MKDHDQGRITKLDLNKDDVLMHYIDKVYMNYRDTTKILERLLYALFFLFFLLIYISIVGKNINFFGIIKEIPSKHVTMLAPVILGFIYMAIGGFSIYKRRLKDKINQLYEDLNLKDTLLGDEKVNNFLVYPSYSEIVNILSRTGKKESATVEYVYSFINLLKVVFVFILPLGFLIYIITPNIYEKYFDFSHILYNVGLYLFLPGVGVVSISWGLHKIYYELIEYVIKKLCSIMKIKNKEKVIGFLSWSIGILVVDFVIILIFFLFFIPSVLLRKDACIVFQWTDLSIIFRNLSLSILIISYATVVIGVLLLNSMHRFKELISILEEKLKK
ncbi:hypothetical protein ACFL9T_05225 [Thermodesulfobacteriota bacterium]